MDCLPEITAGEVLAMLLADDLQPKRAEPLPGALIKQYVRCGKPGCKCAKGEQHGPYWYRFWRDEEGRAHKQYVSRRNLRAVRRAIAEYRRMSVPFSKVRASVKAAARLLGIIERGEVVERYDEVKRCRAILSGERGNG